MTNDGPWDFPIGFVEGTGQTPSMTSLYEAQLAERMTYGVGPDTPAKLSVTSGFVLSWIDVALDEVSYVVERSSDDGATYSILETLAANSISYTDSTANAGAIYYYRVKATNAFGSSAYCNYVSTNPSPTTKPSTSEPTRRPSTSKPTRRPTTSKPTRRPTTSKPKSK